MGRRQAEAITIFLSVMIISATLPVAAQDGSYFGTRYLAPNLPDVCKTTSITGSISNGNVDLMLTYNGTSLNGRLKGNTVQLTGSSGRYRYIFSGRLSGKKLSGSWEVKPRDCWGRWVVYRR